VAKGMNVNPDELAGFAANVKELGITFNADLDSLLPKPAGAAPTVLPGSEDLFKSMDVMSRGLHDWGGGLSGTYLHNAYLALGTRTAWADLDGSNADQLKAALAKVDNGIPAAPPAPPAGGRPPGTGPTSTS
jgi:hypothetical protein